MNDDVAIKVESISKVFQEQVGAKSFKEAFINVGKKLTGKKTDKITKSFTALNDINFEVKKGEFFGIVGRNGSGKSTLLKIIAGVYTPTKGAVTINGKLTPFIELGVGFNPELSGRDNVFLNAALLGFSRKQTAKMYDDIVEFAELKDFMEVKLKNYSSGMQVRLAFSVAIRAESDILLIDEVLAVGDAAFQQKCYDYFTKLKNNGSTVIFISHDMASVRRFCSKAAYISDGQIKEIGKSINVTQTYVNENFGESDKISGNKSDSQKTLPVGVDIEIIGSNKIIDRTDIKIKLKIKSEIERNTAISISLLKDGQYSGGFNTKKYKGDFIIYKGVNIFTANVETKSLGGGVYNIGCGVFEKTNFKPLGLNLEGPKINIQDNLDYKDGIANIDGDIVNTAQTL